MVVEISEGLRGRFGLLRLEVSLAEFWRFGRLLCCYPDFFLGVKSDEQACYSYD